MPLLAQLQALMAALAACLALTGAGLTCIVLGSNPRLRGGRVVRQGLLTGPASAPTLSAAVGLGQVGGRLVARTDQRMVHVDIVLLLLQGDMHTARLSEWQHSQSSPG